MPELRLGGHAVAVVNGNREWSKTLDFQIGFHGVTGYRKNIFDY